MSNIKHFQYDKLHRKATTLYRYHNLTAAVGQVSADGAGLNHHLANLCKAAALPRVRSRWGQTPHVKTQERKKLSFTNVTACSIHRDGHNALASCVHPEAAASVKKSHQLIQLASSPVPKGFLQKEADIKSLDQHQLNYSLVGFSPFHMFINLKVNKLTNLSSKTGNAAAL